ncbi:unnamed protein product, partial [Durusdinium trenchii]
MATMAPRAVDLPPELQEAILECDCESIVTLLERHPEWKRTQFVFEASDRGAASGKQVTGGLLAAALRLNGHMELLEALVEECNVGLDMLTYHVAGSSRLLWSGPVIHDAICAGSVEAVRYLLDQSVDPRAGSTFGDADGATPLWQASFNGFDSIVSLLLDRSAAYDIETPSPWQDRPEHLLTPLHVAARMGHARVVEVLIETGAQYDTRRLLRNGGSSPLRDAIQRCHVEVVKLLVQKDATVPRKALFEFNNEALQPKEAAEVLQRHARSGETSTWCLLLHACKAQLCSARLQSNTIHHNIAISAAEKVGDWRLANSLLWSILEVELALSRVSFNTAISACDKCRQWQMAMELLRRTLQPDSISFFCAMRSERWWDTMCLFHEMLMTRVQPDCTTSNMVLTAAADAVNWQHVMTLLDTAVVTAANLDEISFAIGANALERSKRWQHSLQLHRSNANSQHLRALVSACAEAKAWQRAIGMFGLLEGPQGLQLNIFHCSAFVTALQQNWQGAAALVQRMGFLGISQNVFSCGAMMEACTASAWQLSLSTLKWMLKTRLSPDEFGADTRLAASRRAGWQSAMVALTINASTLNIALGNVGLGLSLTTLEKAVQWLHALDLLDTFARKALRYNVINTNSLISCLEKVGYWRQALPLLFRMGQVNLLPDTVSCSATVSACEEQGRWREAAHLSSKQGNSLMVFAGAVSASEKALRWPRALQVLSMMPQLRLTADLVTFNATLRALERGLCWQMVLEVFEDMPKEGVVPDVVAHNSACLASENSPDCRATLLLMQGAAASWQYTQRCGRGCELAAARVAATAQAKLPGAAWHVLQIMEEASIETNVFHYSAAINACEKAGEWMLALAVVVGMQEKEVMPNTVTMNSAISACEKAEEWTWALHFLDAMPGTSLTRDVISYTSTMNACAKAFLWETALQLFDSMSLEAVVPNTRTYNGAISAFAQAGRWRPALQMLDVMASRALKPNTFSYNAALNACDKGGQWQWAIHLLFYMQQHKVPLDHVSYCTAMTALARDGHWMEAILLLGTMPRPTAAAFTAVISSCERSSQWQVALDVLFSDGHAHLMPYNAAASACEKGTQWPMALHLFASAHTRTLRADVGTLNSVMVACEKGSEWERALTALQLLPLEEADVFVLTTALSAMSRSGSLWEGALELLSQARSLTIPPNAKSFGAALSACKEHWEASLALLESMQKVEVEPGAPHIGVVARALKGCDVEGFLEVFRRKWAKRAKQQDPKLEGSSSTLLGVRHGVIGTNKPPDMETEAFVAQLSRELGFSLYTASRLDYPTSGALPVAFGEGSVDWLEVQFAARSVEKEYLCVCEGPPLDSGVVELPLFTDRYERGGARTVVCTKRGLPARTDYEVISKVTIAAVAEGLTQASKQAVKGCLLPVEWLGMFLRTPGHAPAHILNAIFQSHSLKYFDFENQRQDANMAHFENSSYLNVKEGMPFEEFNDYFVSRQQIGNEGVRLLRGLGVDFSRRSQRADPSQDEVEHYEWDY